MRAREKKEEWKKRTSGVIHTTGLEEDATGSGVDTENKLRGGTLHMSNEVSWCVRGTCAWKEGRRR